MKFFIGAACCLILIQSSAQDTKKHIFSETYYSEEPILNITMHRVEESGMHYKTSFPYSTCNIYLYEDSTFVFYYVDINLYKMAVGNYSCRKGLCILNSDSIKTANAVADPEFYKKYFKFKAPDALRIEKAAYLMNKDQFVPFCTEETRIELLYTSDNLLRYKLKMTPFRTIQYTPSGEEVTVDFGSANKLILPLDSLWGFTVLKNGSLKIYRVTRKGFNWYGVPGVQVVQTGPFIIYTIGEGRLYSYFSRDLNSKIYPLNLEKLKSEFRENTAFLKAVTKEFKPYEFVAAKGRTPESYRVLEIYEESLVKKDQE